MQALLLFGSGMVGAALAICIWRRASGFVQLQRERAATMLTAAPRSDEPKAGEQPKGRRQQSRAERTRLGLWLDERELGGTEEALRGCGIVYLEELLECTDLQDLEGLHLGRDVDVLRLHAEIQAQNEANLLEGLSATTSYYSAPSSPHRE